MNPKLALFAGASIVALSTAAQAQSTTCPTGQFLKALGSPPGACAYTGPSGFGPVGPNSYVGNPTGSAATPTTIPFAALPNLPHIQTLALAQQACAASAGCPLGTIVYSSGFIRDDYAVSNGAEPILYKAEVGPCASNGLVSDGGACFNTSAGDGNSFVAKFPVTGADIREWGVKFDGVTDNSAVISSAFVWWAKGNKLIFPAAAEPAVFSAGVNVTLSIDTSPALMGAAPDQSLLEYTGSNGTAITVQYAGQNNATHWRDWSLLSGQAGLAAGVRLIQNATSIGDPATTPVTDFTNFTLRGADGLSQADYFTSALIVDGVSVINLDGFSWYGSSNGLGNGIIISGAASAFPVVFNIDKSQFHHGSVPLTVGNYTQGVVIGAGTNFTGASNNCVEINGSAGLIAEVSITGTQFNCPGGNQISVDGAILQNLSIVNSLIYVPSTKAGLYYSPSSSGSIGLLSSLANQYVAASNGTGTGIGLETNPTSSTEITTGDTFNGLLTGVAIAGGVTGATIGKNTYPGTSTAVSDSGTLTTYNTQQQIGGGSGANVSSGADLFMGQGNSLNANDEFQATQAIQAGVVRNFYGQLLSATPGAGQSYTFVFWHNGVSTGLNCVVSGAAGFCSDKTHSVTLAPADWWSIQVLATSAATSAPVIWGAQLSQTP